MSEPEPTEPTEPTAQPKKKAFGKPFRKGDDPRRKIFVKRADPAQAADALAAAEPEPADFPNFARAILTDRRVQAALMRLGRRGKLPAGTVRMLVEKCAPSPPPVTLRPTPSEIADSVMRMLPPFYREALADYWRGQRDAEGRPTDPRSWWRWRPVVERPDSAARIDPSEEPNLAADRPLADASKRLRERERATPALSLPESTPGDPGVMEVTPRRVPERRGGSNQGPRIGRRPRAPLADPSIPTPEQARALAAEAALGTAVRGLAGVHDWTDVRHRGGEDGGGGCRACRERWRAESNPGR